ncbi:DUF6319 family protein [Amycolatopsis azurea]|uniref:Mucin n=1 Tax=Amycolatopsis azurea DSM 43854 TaxID=1238180 RepID=M2Q704_9PSEU|nr:DUF6319 family protein [Amycolatopsis azurea]EMD22506.1 hypothetical protein C791_8368 [Amycolatopsis azurea DSM 43854]OOC08386.1 hypothetical protein B0293_00185 [Amycolatopsis azurea DSM 43854]
MTVDALTRTDAVSEEAATEAPVDSTPQAETTSESTEAKTEAPEASGTSETPAEENTAESPKPKRGRPKVATTAKKTRTVELTLTVTGTADGEWQAELKNGAKWVAKGLEIPAAAVSRAAKELHADLSGPIDEVINAARELQAAKVAQLEAELEKAKLALAELDA